jgi:hypothetical protein
MKNKKVIEGVIAIGMIFIIAIFLSGCLDEKSKFIGTWQYSEGGFITFYDNNTVLIDDIGPLGDLQLIGIFDYSIANNQVTFTSGSIGVILNYKFLDSSTLQLSNDAGLSITLIKV